MKRAATLLVCLLALGHGASAWAGQTFTVSNVSVTGDDVTVTAPNGPEATTAGPVMLTTSIGTLAAWCVDLYHAIYTGSGQNLNYQVGALTTNSAPSPQLLTASQLGTIAQLAQYGQSLVAGASATNDQLAAVQLAIWSTEYSNFAYTGAGGANVSAALTAAKSFSATDVGLIALSGTQTLVTASPLLVKAASPVPEPSGLAALCLAIPAFALLRRRRRSCNA